MGTHLSAPLSLCTCCSERTLGVEREEQDEDGGGHRGKAEMPFISDPWGVHYHEPPRATALPVGQPPGPEAQDL